MSTPAYPAGVWCADFEFHPEHGQDGNPVVPICLVVQEVHAGVIRRYWRDELIGMSQAPFPTTAEALLVAYSASAEMACFAALNWPFPANVLDLYAEFRNLTNGLMLPAGKGLLGALTYFGEPCMAATQKDVMRDLILSAGPWTADEREAISAYCEADVVALVRLYRRMAGGLIDWPRAVLRGRYAICAAVSESRGVPLDLDIYATLRAQSPRIRQQLIAEVDAAYGVYTQGSFREARFAEYLARQVIAWPRLKSGRLQLDDDTFREMARVYPQLTPLRQLRQALVQLRDIKLTVGADGRNRFALFPFSSLTGRNQPSTSRSIFGLGSWLRGLIRPLPGHALAYIDFSQQELAIAAKLSGDEAMQHAYRSDDFYMSLAITAGFAPPGATKASHPQVRERFKVCALGVLFGMTEEGLARRLGLSSLDARRLLDAHRQTFPAFWKWSDAVADHAMLTGSLRTVFGWTLHLDRQPNVRSLRNFPMQANGAEMMRLAHAELVRQGIQVCTPVHDAFLIEAPLDEIETVVERAQAIMRQASAIVLDGFEVRSEAQIVRYPQRFMEAKGVAMWNRVMLLLERCDWCVEVQA